MRTAGFEHTLDKAATGVHFQKSVMRNGFFALAGDRHACALTLISAHGGIHRTIHPRHPANHRTIEAFDGTRL